MFELTMGQQCRFLTLLISMLLCLQVLRNKVKRNFSSSESRIGSGAQQKLAPDLPTLGIRYNFCYLFSFSFFLYFFLIFFLSFLYYLLNKLYNATYITKQILLFFSLFFFPFFSFLVFVFSFFSLLAFFFI